MRSYLILSLPKKRINTPFRRINIEYDRNEKELKQCVNLHK